MSSIIQFVENKRQSGRKPVISNVSLMYLFQIFESKLPINSQFEKLLIKSGNLLLAHPGIFKTGNTSNSNSCKPLFLLSQFSQIFEKLLYKRLSYLAKMIFKQIISLVFDKIH